MTKAIVIVPLLSFLISHAHCEDAANTHTFEVASVTPCAPGTPEPPGEHMGMVRFIYPGGNFTARATTVKYLMEWAYGILPVQHSDGPGWMKEDRYDIVAKANGNPSEAEMKLMVQNLLAERFHLKFHRESKELPILVLSLGKNPPKLFPPKEGEVFGMKMTPRTSDDHQKVVSYHTSATRFSFAQLNLTFATVLGRIIVNQTGLEGDYDFELDFTPDENRPSPLDPSLIISAIRDQLGLNVKAEKGPADYFVVDTVDKVAAGN
jgi:uncharacterized protein (TIGR03435 family)